jgi:hypothetical protein
MKRFIVTNKQLSEYVENKKAEKVYYDILECLHKNMKNLNESVSLKGANQSVIDNFKRKNLITPKVQEMLIKHKIIDEKHEII